MDHEMQRQYLIDVMGLSPEEIDKLPVSEASKKIMAEKSRVLTSIRKCRFL